MADGLLTFDRADQGSASSRDGNPTHWTARSAWRANTHVARLAAVVVAAAAVAATALDAVSIVSAVGVIATIPAGLVDVVDRRLPDPMVGAAAAVLLVCVALDLALGGGPTLGQFVVGAATMSAPLLVLHLVSPASMGFGGVKLAVVLGASLGLVHPQLPLVALFLGAAGSAAVGIARRSRHVAFGPGLIAGAAAALVCSGVVGAA